MFRFNNQEISGAKYRVLKVRTKGPLVDQAVDEALNYLESEINKLNSDDFNKSNITLIGSPSIVITPGKETAIIYYVTVAQAMLVSIAQ